MESLSLNIYDRHGRVEAPSAATAVTIGVFDGVHRGHCDLVRQLRVHDEALQPAVVTLLSHPAFVLGRRGAELWLDEPEEHRTRLFDAGAAYVVELPFTPQVAQLSACRMASLLAERLQMQHLLIGYDSRFGSMQHDDFDNLPRCGKELGFSVATGVRYLWDGNSVSSSAIRHALQQGAVHTAAQLLGRPYALQGRVQHGRGVGHTMGFPTANIDTSGSRKMLPAEGVYAVRLNGMSAVANLGTAPTFGIQNRTLEVHVIGFDGDLYGQQAEVSFVRRLRGTQHFDTPQALQQQMQHDVTAAKQWL